MDTLNAIFTRRSIRAYTNDPVSDQAVDTLLRAAMVAPSALDERPWHFVVVRERRTLQALAEAMEHCDLLRGTPVGIVFCGDPRLEKIPGMDFWVQDCAACVQNVHLAAHALGLGSVWVALHPLPNRVGAVRRALMIPPEVIPFALLSVGYPAEHHGGEDRFEAGRIHQERWGGLDQESRRSAGI